MSDIAVSVEHLSKCYKIGHLRDTRDGLRHAIENICRHPLQWWSERRRTKQKATEEYWALRDVSFEVKQGDVVGIIGRNGAGKSTLLKLLTQITEPSTGRIQINSRVASLLEVGTGFHPELTGRENIFLNGAILGMSRAEIKSKFDEIVAFSEIEKFLDTPVKRYSSGMYVRLAFSVAAHLEPEILIIDEVLAVGDAQFQRKCLGKMGEVAKGGRTVLFVSHNMSIMHQLCNTGLLLDRGQVVQYGPMPSVISKYLTTAVSQTGAWKRSAEVPTSPGVYFEGVAVIGEQGNMSGHVPCNVAFTIQIDVHATANFRNAQIAVRFTNEEGVAVLTTCPADYTREYQSITEGRHRYRLKMPAQLLAPGNYVLQLAAQIPRVQAFDLLDNAIAVCVEDTGSLRSLFSDNRVGVVEPVLEWSQQRAPSAGPTEPALAIAV